MAALMGAAMCALSSDLNAFASVGVEDIYRLMRPDSTDRAAAARGEVHRDRVRRAGDRDGAGFVAYADGRRFRCGSRRRR